MNADVQWFGYLGVERGLLTPESCRELGEYFGTEAELLTLAQAVIDHRLCEDFEGVQTLVNDAFRAAQTQGLPPTDYFAPPAAEPEAGTAEVHAVREDDLPTDHLEHQARVAPAPSEDDVPTDHQDREGQGEVAPGPRVDLNPSPTPDVLAETGAAAAPAPSKTKAAAVDLEQAAAALVARAAAATEPLPAAEVQATPPAARPVPAARVPAPSPSRAAAPVKRVAPVPPPPEPAAAAEGPGEEGHEAEETAAAVAAGPAVAPKSFIPDIVPSSVAEILEHPSLPVLTNLESLSDADAASLMTQLLQAVRSYGASDLHLSAAGQPFVRRNLVLEKFSDGLLSPAASFLLNVALLTEEQRAHFFKNRDLDYALQMEDGTRCRVNLMLHKDGVAGAYRLLPTEVRSLEALGFSDHKIISKFLTHHNGLILITGPAGCGKTTTLAALIAECNETRDDHIITVEDPIEIVQWPRRCNVTQREVGRHTRSFASALKAALRENPDIIIIGELRDLETIEMAITAAETGHLVIGTLHTSDSATTLNRLLDVFPPAQQPQIRAMTAESLRGIVCQRLVPTIEGGLAVACELLINTIAVANIIRDGKMFQLKQVLETGLAQGMHSMDYSVFEMFQAGRITQEVALAYLRESSFIKRLKEQTRTTPAAGAAAAEEGGDKDAAKKKKWGLFR